MQDLNQMCQTYHGIKNQIKVLDSQAEKLAESIISAVGHDHIGQKTYDDLLPSQKLTIITKENYTLDKAKLNATWDATLPINRSFSYTLREKDYKALVESGDASIKKRLFDIVTSKPAKPVIKLENK